MYIDDIVLYTNTLEEHEAKFHELAERLMEYGLKVQPKKCEFLKKEVAYLGYVISKDRVKPDRSQEDSGDSRISFSGEPEKDKSISGTSGVLQEIYTQLFKDIEATDVPVKEGRFFRLEEPPTGRLR